MAASFTDQLIIIAVNVTPKKCSGPVNIKNNRKWTLEKTDVAVKNGQSRESGNIGCTRHKQNNNKKRNAEK